MSQSELPIFGEGAPAPKPSGRRGSFRESRPGVLAFSYSKLTMYEECPLKYRFRYVDKLKEKPKPYFAFGQSIHAALEFLYGVKAPPFPSKEETLEAFRADWRQKTWLAKGYRSPEAEEEDYAKGVAMLSAYYDRHAPDMKPPFLLEYSTDVELDGLQVRIVADKIEYLGAGGISIIDYKTGKDVKREPGQLYMYQKICELDPCLPEKVAEQYGHRVSEVRVRSLKYYHVPSLKEYSFERAPEKEIGVFWERVMKSAGAIKAGNFDPTPGEFQCRFCDFREFCPAMSSGAPRPLPSAESPRPVAPPLPAAAEDAATLPDLVDRYGDLASQSAKLAAELESVKARILALSSGGHLQGGRWTLDLKRTEKWTFRDREAVIKILKAHGLYEKTLSPTLKAITDLLGDLSAPEPMKAELRRAGERSWAAEFHHRKKEEA